MYTLTEMTDFTSHGIKKRRQNKKLGLEKTMTAEIKRKWGETRCLKPIGIYNGNSEAKSCWLKSGGSS